MKKMTSTLLAAAITLSTAVSPLASENTAGTPGLRVMARPVALDTAEVAKYQQMTVQPKELALRDAAGASNATKVVLVVAGVAVVAAGIALLEWHNHGMAWNGPIKWGGGSY